jgi:hypothetical protein
MSDNVLISTHIPIQMKAYLDGRAQPTSEIIREALRWYLNLSPPDHPDNYLATTQPVEPARQRTGQTFTVHLCPEFAMRIEVSSKSAELIFAEALTQYFKLDPITLEPVAATKPRRKARSKTKR